VLFSYSKTGGYNTATKAASNKFIFCEVVQQDRFYTGSVTTIFANFGTTSTYSDRMEESKFIKLQTNGVDVLNYMSDNDWELVTKNVREFSTSGLETVYVLRKMAR